MFANSTRLRGELGVAPGPQLAVAVHHEVEVVVGGDVEQAAPGVEAGRDLAAAVERRRSRSATCRSARCGSRRRASHAGQDVLALLHPVPAVGVELAGDVVVVGVLAGDEGRARRAAERKGVDRVLEARSPGGRADGARSASPRRSVLAMSSVITTRMFGRSSAPVSAARAPARSLSPSVSAVASTVSTRTAAARVLRVAAWTTVASMRLLARSMVCATEWHTLSQFAELGFRPSAQAPSRRPSAARLAAATATGSSSCG